MKHNRRNFIKLTSTIGAGLALAPFTNTLSGCSAISHSRVQSNIGLQLYTLRDVLPTDPKGILTQVASFGYKLIETYNHETLGLYWGMKNTEFKKLMDDLGMTLVAAHYNYGKDFEKIADEAAAIGIKYLVSPSLDHVFNRKGEYQFTLDDWKEGAAILNKAAVLCKDRGLKYSYHNHDASFKTINGVIPQDLFMQQTDAALVDFEMDIYWITTAGQDPVTWLKKYPNRFKLFHVKDRKKGIPLSVKDASVALGTGGIDFSAIIATAGDKGNYYFVEQEIYENSTPMKDAKANADYLKNLKY